jgi:hypothetical protein
VPEPGPVVVVLVVDVANVMGSRPDGWWRDRAGAATRLAGELARLAGTDAVLEPGPVHLTRVVAVVEGRARPATAPAGVELVRAPADGDSTIVDVARTLLEAGHRPLVVTADRGLRERLPAGSRVAGPGWLLRLIAGTG